MRSDYELVAAEWDAITEEYMNSLKDLVGSPHNVMACAWLAYKTRESELLRSHGWTVLEFEREGDKRAVSIFGGLALRTKTA